MSYFDPRPKTNRRDLYNMNEELNLLKKFVKSSPFILIKGLRRTGKTSLVYTAINEFKLDAIIFDLRILPYEGKIEIEEFMDLVINEINKFLDTHAKLRKLFVEFLKNVDGIEIKGLRVKFKKEERKSVQLIDIFEAIDKFAKKRKKRCFLVFDEAQELRKLAKYRMDKLMAYIYDNFRMLSLILTGSEIGIIDDFLRLTDPDSPLYGRAIDEITLRPFFPDTAREFLIKGYIQHGIKPSFDFIEYAIEKLNGIPGWLTLLGWETRNKKRLSRKFVDRVLERASSLALKEFNSFLSFRWQAKERYKIIMKILANAGEISWKRLKNLVEIEKGRMSDKTFNHLLEILVKSGFVIKENGKYKISDPVLKHALLK